MIGDLNNLYQQLIIDHGRHPRNFGVLENADYTKEGFNPLCGDKITLYLNVVDGLINEIKFDGSGCAISIASASLMTQAVINKPIEYCDDIFKTFHDLLTGKEINQDNKNQLGKLAVLEGVRAYPMRVKCATLAWHTLQSAIENES